MWFPSFLKDNYILERIAFLALHGGFYDERLDKKSKFSLQLLINQIEDCMPSKANGENAAQAKLEVKGNNLELRLKPKCPWTIK